MRLIIPVAALAMLAACSGRASEEDQLDAAADQSTPAAAEVLEGAADNGMNAQDALNEAAEAQAANTAGVEPGVGEQANAAANTQ